MSNLVTVVSIQGVVTAEHSCPANESFIEITNDKGERLPWNLGVFTQKEEFIPKTFIQINVLFNINNPEDAMEKLVSNYVGSVEENATFDGTVIIGRITEDELNELHEKYMARYQVTLAAQRATIIYYLNWDKTGLFNEKTTQELANLFMYSHMGTIDKVDLSYYRQIGQVDIDDLNVIYERFNRIGDDIPCWLPKTERSMSCGDIIAVEKNGTYSYMMVVGVGFKEVQIEK